MRAILLTAALIAAPAAAATHHARTHADTGAASACAAASELQGAKVSRDVMRFSDAAGVDARVVTGTYKPRHMRGREAQMLCLFNRKSHHAEVQELAMSAPAPVPEEAAAPEPAAPASTGPGPKLTGPAWRAVDVGGKALAADAAVTLTFANGGRVSGQSGCNHFSARYHGPGSDAGAQGDLTIGALASTRMACSAARMRTEREVEGALGKARAYAIAPDGTLAIIGDGPALRLRAEAGGRTKATHARRKHRRGAAQA